MYRGSRVNAYLSYLLLSGEPEESVNGLGGSLRRNPFYSQTLGVWEPSLKQPNEFLRVPQTVYQDFHRWPTVCSTSHTRTVACMPATNTKDIMQTVLYFTADLVTALVSFEDCDSGRKNSFDVPDPHTSV